LFFFKNNKLLDNIKTTQKETQKEVNSYKKLYDDELAKVNKFNRNMSPCRPPVSDEKFVCGSFYFLLLNYLLTTPRRHSHTHV
jgi:hypothetical protein